MPQNSFSRNSHSAYVTKVSIRRRGFSVAFRHNIPIEIEECGTPAVNLEGRIIGINIAQVDRTGSSTIPINHVYKVVQSILNKSNN